MASSDVTGEELAASVNAASLPWAFTQRHPLNTSQFISEAKRRGYGLDTLTLRELYRVQVLAPFLYANDRRVGPVPPPVEGEPRPGGSLLIELRYARDRGRLSDPASAPFRPRLRFDERGLDDPQGWWNGLIFSRYQSLALPAVSDLLARRTHWVRGGVRRPRLAAPDRFLLDQAARLRAVTVALTALEARYLPKLDAELIQLVNAEPDDWQAYRDSFDPVATSRRLHYSADQARADAEWLLHRADQLDPVGRPWSRLIRRAPQRSWRELKDNALLAMDYREAAEVLLLFYEDLADRGQAKPLQVDTGMSHGRLSYRDGTLDEDLSSLGISPHPRVVLAVEGDTEELHVPRVWKALDLPDAPELMRLLKLGTVDRDLQKVAALAAAPLISSKAQVRDAWFLIKPPSCLFIAVDPEGSFSDRKRDRTRAGILNEIRAVLKAQGVTRPNPAELERLVEVRTWKESCYEYANFSDDELASGIMAVHPTINGWTREQLVAALAHWRAQRVDIKRVWESGAWDDQLGRPTGPWEHGVSKPELAEALWPILEEKIERAKVDPDAEVPEIAEVVLDAYHIAQAWRYTSFVLREEPEKPANGDAAGA